MPIGPISGASSRISLHDEEHESTNSRANSPHNQPMVESPIGSQPDEAAAALSRQSSHSSLASNYEGLGRGEIDPSKIQETAISNALRGKPIEDPVHVSVGDRLAPHLAMLAEESDSRGQFAKFAGDVKEGSSRLARRVSTSTSRILRRQSGMARIKDQELDAKRREQELNQRDRELDKLQDAQTLAVRRAVRGGTRE
jgi:hypothetical protein